MEITSIEARDAFIALQRLNKEVKLKVKLAYWLGRLQNDLKSLAIAFETEHRKRMIEAGAIQEDGGLVIKPPVYEDLPEGERESARAHHVQKLTALSEEIEALGREKVQVAFEPIKLDEFGDSVEISPDVFAALAPFLRE